MRRKRWNESGIHARIVRARQTELASGALSTVLKDVASKIIEETTTPRTQRSHKRCGNALWASWSAKKVKRMVDSPVARMPVAKIESVNPRRMRHTFYLYRTTTMHCGFTYSPYTTDK